MCLHRNTPDATKKKKLQLGLNEASHDEEMKSFPAGLCLISVLFELLQLHKSRTLVFIVSELLLKPVRDLKLTFEAEHTQDDDQGAGDDSAQLQKRNEDDKVLNSV